MIVCDNDVFAVHYMKIYPSTLQPLSLIPKISTPAPLLVILESTYKIQNHKSTLSPCQEIVPNGN